MTTCVITQPRLFPGLHYLHRMMIADVFVIFDSVQFTPRHEENRAKIKTANGPKWLTVPVRRSGRGQLIRDTRVDGEQPWQRKTLASLEHAYGKAPRFDAHIGAVVDIVEGPHETLCSIDRASWEPALKLLQPPCRFVWASELPVSGSGPEQLLKICESVGADRYVSGAFGRTYLDREPFAKRGIELCFHEYEYPEYPQRFGEFVPFLSYLDVLFNVGLDPDIVAPTGKLVSI